MHFMRTSCSSELGVYIYAAAQVKKAMEVTHYLGGENFVFWGGREGYQTLLNTDMKRELDHLARFLQAAVDWKKKIGFNGTLLIEPKPQEPTKHQYVYDWDAATTLSFLQKYGLSGEFKLNIECNHATLSGHRRRESTDVEDLFIAHISGMDTLAQGLQNAAKLIADGYLDELIRKRYESFDSGIGSQIEA
ncbi:putative xylose isomerase [Dioscorea sansibarensis]